MRRSTRRSPRLRGSTHLLSNYRAESEWSEVNRRAAEGSVRVSPELFELLSKCMATSRASEGAFDIAVGPLMKLWGFYKGSGRLPSRAEVDSVLPSVGWRHVHLDEKNRTVRFDCAGVELDPAESARDTPWTAWWTSCEGGDL